jgi:DNA-directed RNA polymerase subunit beta'
MEKIFKKLLEKDGQKILIGQAGQKIIKITSEETKEERYALLGEEKIFKKDGEKVEEGEVILRRKDGTEVKAQHAGQIRRGRKEISVVYLNKIIKEYVIPSDYILWVKNGDWVEPGTQLTEGHLDLHELYRLKGREAVERYMLKEIQFIYSSQGQKLNDKHLELIIRQMFSRVYVKDAGDTDLLPGEIVERAEFEEENEKVRKNGGRQAEGEPLLLGITRVALTTRSFLSAASFQETARVLINAAVTGKVDKLEGLKENVIIGRLIPAGTGFRKKEKNKK